MINEDEELREEEVRLPPDHTVSKMRLVRMGLGMNLLVGGRSTCPGGFEMRTISLERRFYVRTCYVGQSSPTTLRSCLRKHNRSARKIFHPFSYFVFINWVSIATSLAFIFLVFRAGILAPHFGSKFREEEQSIRILHALESSCIIGIHSAVAGFIVENPSSSQSPTKEKGEWW